MFVKPMLSIPVPFRIDDTWSGGRLGIESRFSMPWCGVKPPWSSPAGVNAGWPKSLWKSLCIPAGVMPPCIGVIPPCCRFNGVIPPWCSKPDGVMPPCVRLPGVIGIFGSECIPDWLGVPISEKHGVTDGGGIRSNRELLSSIGIATESLSWAARPGSILKSASCVVGHFRLRPRLFMMFVSGSVGCCSSANTSAGPNMEKSSIPIDFDTKWRWLFCGNACKVRGVRRQNP